MKVLILGGDGYLGWPTAMRFSKLGHEVLVVDNFAKRKWELERGVRPLVPIPTLHERARVWEKIGGSRIEVAVGDITNHRFIYGVMERFLPDVVVHYAEQPSAPYSMIGRESAVFTQVNNIVGTLNVLFAIKKFRPDCHLIKLGTMGEYGTPDIDVEEGFITIEHKGRKDTLPFPKMAGSFYHLSKVHDSHNIHFVCRAWGLRSTDLNQGPVYGIDTEETTLDERLATSFHYDEIFGTALNRLCAEAVCGFPLTVYGKGGQKRGFLNILDTLQCVLLAALNPPKEGEYRVFNQFTEVFSVLELANLVKESGEALGLRVVVNSIPNPRVEKEEHYYNPVNKKLIDLGLKSHYLSDALTSILKTLMKYKDNIDTQTIAPTVKWKQT
jgi:UDP-sulfoquinovose synthase